MGESKQDKRVRKDNDEALTSGYSWNQPLGLRIFGSQLLFRSSSSSFSLPSLYLPLSFFNFLSNSPFFPLLKESV